MEGRLIKKILQKDMTLSDLVGKLDAHVDHTFLIPN